MKEGRGKKVCLQLLPILPKAGKNRGNRARFHFAGVKDKKRSCDSFWCGRDEKRKKEDVSFSIFRALVRQLGGNAMRAKK